MKANGLYFGVNQLGSSARPAGLNCLCVWTIHIHQAIFKTQQQEINMEYSIFPTERSAKKWATEHILRSILLTGICIEAVKEAGWVNKAGQLGGEYQAGEYWVWYKLSDLKGF